MKLQNELEVERIFSYAMGLEQSGRQKNMIFGSENVICILNTDKTVLLRFQTTRSEFPNPIGFYASDYDSSEYETIGGFISFIKNNQEFTRKKKCRVPSQTFGEVDDLFFQFYDYDRKFPASITFSKSSLDLLEESLSHIEFMSRNHQLAILQRDIYSGTLIELERKKAEGLGLTLYEDEIVEDFGPLGMRTNDFFALFNFNDQIKIHFLSPQDYYFLIEGAHNVMWGVVAGCLYDELGKLNYLQKEVEPNGRKESQDRISQQETNREVKTKKPLCRKRG